MCHLLEVIWTAGVSYAELNENLKAPVELIPKEKPLLPKEINSSPEEA